MASSWARLWDFGTSWASASWAPPNDVFMAAPFGGGGGFDITVRNSAGTGGDTHASSVSFPTNAWTHVVLTYAANGAVALYINGASVFSTTISYTFTTVYRPYLWIGKSLYSVANSPPDPLFAGAMAAFQLAIGTILSAADVINLHNNLGCPTVVTPSICTAANSPVACFDPSSVSGSSWTDLSGNGNHLAFSGTVSVGTAAGASATGVYFGGATSASAGTYTPALGTSFTFAAWVWPTGAGMYVFSVGRGPNNANFQATYQLYSVGTAYYWDFYNNGGSDYGSGFSNYQTTGWTQNAWNHVGFVRTNGNVGALASLRPSRQTGREQAQQRMRVVGRPPTAALKPARNAPPRRHLLPERGCVWIQRVSLAHRKSVQPVPCARRQHPGRRPVL